MKYIKLMSDTKRPAHKLDDEFLFGYREAKDFDDVAILIEEPMSSLILIIVMRLSASTTSWKVRTLTAGS